MSLDEQRASRRATEYHLCRTAVSQVTDLGPHLRRLTLTGPGLGFLPYAGPDQRVKLLLNDHPERLPHDGRPYPISRFMGLMVKAAVRGTAIRTYTVRHHRPESAEIDIDFALHGIPGPASRWAAQAEVGSQAAIFGPACEYRAPEPGAWLLLAGDDTALPAIAAILESLPTDARGRAIIEVADRADVQPLQAPTGVEVSWLDRGSTPAQASTLLLDTVAELELPDQLLWAWLAGEASVTTRIRRHLVHERGVDRKQVRFSGYWKHGRADSST